MSSITFYRQQRIDGGIRTGVEVGGNTVLSMFKSGKGEDDPALLWYVDVKCEGRALPKNSKAARKWLEQHEKTVRQILDSLAEKVEVGVDSDCWPVKKDGVISGVKITISCSAIRRLEARKIANIIRDIGEHWNEYVGDLVTV